jgi:hypothetical protein
VLPVCHQAVGQNEGITPETDRAERQEESNVAKVEQMIQLRWDIWIKELKWRVMYLYPPPVDFQDIRELLAQGARGRFLKEVQTHTKALLLNEKEPPEAIAGAIRNFADDIAAGREVTVRAGDYIAVQNYIKSKKG